jgi:excisionase family DNA binding protein
MDPTSTAALQPAVDDLTTPNQHLDGDALLTAEEAAAILRVSTGWVYEQARRSRLPHVRLGRYVRIRRATLDSWLTDGEAASALAAPRAHADKKHRMRSV